MKKKILAVIGIGIITVTALAGCSQESIDTGAVTTVADTTVQSTTTEPQATTKPAESTTKADESSTTEKATTKKKNSTTTTKATVAKTTAKAKTTTDKSTAKSTTKATTKATTKKVTTTKKKTTTTKKKTTTVKNVTAKEVQNQVNAYIRSKGITVDSSLRPNNSGWSVPISNLQEDLNNGYIFNECKYKVNMYINEMGTNISIYCYYDNSDFYVLYL